ncbi:MAG TPA: type II toxin-antitoxin system VapC family toxin [Dongiaceae bacterium]|nr:type II toxin-antitoxin system VapC family toxin [Dongiaceae bacterium]
MRAEEPRAAFAALSTCPEIASVLCKQVRAGRSNQQVVERILDECLKMRWSIVPASELIESALKIALRHGRSVYDCLYVALALQTGSEMVTADERLVHAVGPAYPVRWLGSL